LHRGVQILRTSERCRAELLGSVRVEGRVKAPTLQHAYRVDAPASVATSSIERLPAHTHRRRTILVEIVGAALVVILVGAGLLYCGESRVNHASLADQPQPVSVVAAKRASYRDSRSYIGTIQPWIEANVGPQYISAYVLTVTVRPGDVVARGAVVATLDCSNPRTASQAAQMQARALNAHEHAIADESDRIEQLTRGGFAAVNEFELKQAESRSASAQLLEANAHLASAQLGVADCTLQSPFEGEIASRVLDPGAFARPGETIVSVVDRHIDRVTGDAPEKDVDVVAFGADVTVAVLSTGATLTATISRRAPRADPSTRTVHFEIDVPDPRRAIPVGTTGIIHIDVSQPVPATEIPAYAASVTEGTATLFVADHGVARKRALALIGTRGGALYFHPDQLPDGTDVVSEGRALLADGDRIATKPELPRPPQGSDDASARGGGVGAPM
jgi:RND family efflux transporter MFP subunit